MRLRAVVTIWHDMTAHDMAVAAPRPCLVLRMGRVGLQMGCAWSRYTIGMGGWVHSRRMLPGGAGTKREQREGKRQELVRACVHLSDQKLLPCYHFITPSSVPLALGAAEEGIT